MISLELSAEILRLFHNEHWPVHTIAKQLRVHHSTVQRAIERGGLPVLRAKRNSKVDVFLPFIHDTLRRYPSICASRLLHMVRERGYSGQPSHFRSIVARYRPKRPAEAYLRLRTLPGEQAQVDWAHFGTLRVGNAERPLVAFLLVLSYSRAIFLRFFLGQSLGYFLRGHEEAFAQWQGVPRVNLYDNLKSVVLERMQDAIRFHPRFLEFAKHYRFEPRPVAVCRGNEKGRVERAIGYVRTSFFAARPFRDLADLNRQADLWCQGFSMERDWPEDRKRKVSEVFEEERRKLLALPDNPYPCDDRLDVHIGKTPYARFDKNDYSVPHTLVQSTLTVVATCDTVRIVNGVEVVASHARSYDEQQIIENPAHVEALREKKKRAKWHTSMNRLVRTIPIVETLFEKRAERGLPLARTASELLLLLNTYGTVAMRRAVTEALAKDAFCAADVQLILDREVKARAQRPPLAVPLPDDPRIQNLTVTPHSLESYDHIQEVSDESRRATEIP